MTKGFCTMFVWLTLLLVFALPVLAAGDSQIYGAALPAQLSSEAELCAYVPCREVMPAADTFSPRIGQPRYVEAYASVNGVKQLIGYVFLSTDIVDIPAYSGKPIVTLIGMDTRGVITGTKVLRHSEPILLLGIPEAQLTGFIHQYVGKFIGSRMEIGNSRASEGYIGLDAISGATVTVVAENQVIVRSAMEVAKQVGILKPTRRTPARLAAANAPSDWQTLLALGAVERLTVQPGEVGKESSDKPYLDIYFGALNAPLVGRSMLGETGYASLMARLQPGEQAIFVIASGSDSFKGSGFVRGGIFDRIEVAQDMDTFTFRDADYLNLYDVKAPGAPAFSESGIFIVRNPGFSLAYPWNLVILANRKDKDTGERTFVSFQREYWLPAQALVGGRSSYQRPAPIWLSIWQARIVEIALFVMLLGSAGAIYALRDRLVRRATRRDKRWVALPKYALWVTSIGFAGFHLMAQPSVTQVLTWFHSILFKWQWNLFLSDPFIFLFWCFIIVSVFFWGRGMFCGWLCPYGALTEIVHKLARRLGLQRFQGKLPQALHDRLKWLKYAVFLALLAVSFYSMGMAEKMAEIEPFKTTFLVGVWNRSWPFVTFWSLLLLASVFIERPFCKYLCPLGASLAIPSTFRWWGLKRKAECGPCDACGAGCASQAIDDKGRIDQRECMLCLDCMVMYYDAHSCPPLAQERKSRLKLGMPLTPIAASGYYIPIKAIAASASPLAAASPPGGALAWWRAELVDHLLPWNRQFLGHPLFFRAAGIGLAVLVTWTWLLGAAGKLGPAIILGWWLAWSAYEMVTRMHCKPQVKDGPWWGSNLRVAGWADMASYVAMKNLLIGAGLFLAMKGMGTLQFLQGIPELRWLH